MADNKPLIRLQPGGKATVLNYNVPDSTSYPGRNYIELQFGDDYFPEEPQRQGFTALAGFSPRSMALSELRNTVQAAMEAGFSNQNVFPDLRLGPGILRLVSDKTQNYRVVSDVPISPKLAALDPGEVATMLTSGHRLHVYRSLFGTLTYTYIKDTLPSNNNELDHRLHDPSFPPTVPLPLSEIAITSPDPGATISGQQPGVLVNITGTTTAIRRRIQSVQVKVGANAAVTATPKAPNDWSTWTASDTINAPRTQTVVATATMAPLATEPPLTVTDATEITIVITANPADTTPPSVVITTPTDDAQLTGPDNGLVLNVTGSASDADSGVSLVEITLDHDPAAYVAAAPRAAGDWATWTGVVTVKTSGSHTITARAKDNVGNVSEAKTTLTVTLQKPPPPIRRLLLVEEYRLSSYLGNYGAGRTLRTFSLLPGEKTNISVKTYTKRTEDAKAAQSILDSFTQDSSDNFEKSVTAEQSNKDGHTESQNYNVEAQVGAAWGWGSASVKGGVSGGTNASREELAKNTSNATQKHVASASAKRNIQVDTDNEVKTETGEETSITRTIENINVGRTLNFVFRQLNQEFFSILHLVNVKVAYYKEVPDGTGDSKKFYREVSLSQLDPFIDGIIADGLNSDGVNRREDVKATIRHLLENIFDYRDTQYVLYEERDFVDPNGKTVPGSGYLRVRKDIESKFQDQTTGSSFTVPGVIMAVTKNILRTEGVIVEALLGEGDALDPYSHGLQDEKVKTQRLSNSLTDAEVDKVRTALQLIKDRDTAGADLFRELFPCCPPAVVGPFPVKLVNGSVPESE